MDNILNPAMVGILMFLASVLWMLQNEKDRSRPLLAGAVLVNLFYGSLLSAAMGHADSLLPWKFDFYLFHMDAALGVSAASVVKVVGDWGRSVLNYVYQLLVPLMVAWLFFHRRRPAGLIRAYVGELLGAPVLYAVLPACGPLYAFGGGWVQAGNVPMAATRLSGMPNAFPSLHLATALVLACYSEGRIWRGLSLVFLMATALATLTTGEHYVVDLVGGLAFGCSAAAAGRLKWVEAATFLGLTFTWAISIRVFGEAMAANATGLRLAAVLTVVVSLRAMWIGWQASPAMKPLPGEEYPSATERRLPPECQLG